jgi:uncharacterized Zn-binding protein involved in type VI secretion
MPAAARGDGDDSVISKTGTGDECKKPVGTSTDECSDKVFVEGTGVVREGDQVAAHNKAGCSNDSSTLSSFSSKVFIQGKGAGRIGDQYGGDNTITSGSSKVFMG